MSQQVFKAPTTGSWNKGRFYSFVGRCDGMCSGVVIDRDVGGHTLIAQNKAITEASCVSDLLSLAGTMASSDYFSWLDRA